MSTRDFSLFRDRLRHAWCLVTCTLKRAEEARATAKKLTDLCAKEKMQGIAEYCGGIPTGHLRSKTKTPWHARGDPGRASVGPESRRASAQRRRTFREVVQIWRAGTGLMHSSSVET
jgi:hypothetical protein